MLQNAQCVRLRFYLRYLRYTHKVDSAELDSKLKNPFKQVSFSSSIID
jgi:hypothetical protein